MIRLAVVLLLAVAAALPAGAFETRARAAWVYDLTTDTVLLEKNADTPLPPASMSKLMTINMLFEALRAGLVSLDTTFPVSTKARTMIGSKMFLDERDRPTVEDLIRGIVVHSGNDATVVVAEGLAGSEEAFAQLMNKRAEALGMKNSSFANASGLPDPNQLMSVRDLGILARRIITEFPEYYPYFSEKEFTWKGITQPNRDPLLYLDIGADGLKTGFTDESGYGLVGSAEQGDRRIIFVIAGLNSERERAEEGESVVNWAFRQFVQKTLVDAGVTVARAPVFLGEATRVGLVAQDDVRLLLPALAVEDLKAELRYSSPIMAPVSAGQELAEMVIEIPDRKPVTVPLVAAADVGKAGFVTRLKVAAGVLANRLLAQIGI